MYETAEQLSTKPNPEQFNQYERHRNDTETWLAEALNGSMRTRFEYQFDGYELYGQDGGRLDEIFDDAIEAAQIVTRQKPSLLFELRRRLIEKDEYENMLAMAKGELADEAGQTINTMVVISDFPPELMESGDDIGGYNVSRKQTMMRVITRKPNGDINMLTQSLDGSDRTALEAIYHKLGQPPQDGEFLSQRIMRNIPEQWHDQLPENLKNTYDLTLSEKYGGEWNAGIRLSDEQAQINTYEFACAQTDLIELFTEAKMTSPLEAEKLRYKIAATASQRLEKYQANENLVTSFIANMPQTQIWLMDEIEQASNLAAIQGKVFSGCGSSVGSADQLKESGYGNKFDEDEYGPLQFKCKAGHTNVRTPGKLMPECPTCKDGGKSVRC